ncbi:MAG: amidohydrolase family protein, partial [Faecalibacterium prausnitzii]
YIIRKAIAAGVDPVVAVRMGTLVPCQYFGLAHSGAVAPGYTADLIVLSDLEKFTVEQVYKKGKLVAQQGKMLHPAALAVDKARFARVFDSFNMDEITPEQLQLEQTGTRQRVICLTPHSLLTTEKIVPFCQHPGTAPGVDVTQQIVKLAVFERHHRSGHVGLGFWATTACNAAQWLPALLTTPTTSSWRAPTMPTWCWRATRCAKIRAALPLR